eukprot:TRINITY_DN19017_c0_g1_i2.p1 TRINITY_DN19017_c0_g1~~TRINITY_DN19017_c0_g1_i2.p1  ORF type:complete len:352 (+),score=81.37 TRINITY_DN19017_c0_g1_i2:56-1111(+)
MGARARYAGIFWLSSTVARATSSSARCVAPARAVALRGALEASQGCRAFATADGGERQYWDLTPDMKVEHKFTDEDVQRFARERARFAADPRLQPESLPSAIVAEELDAVGNLKVLASILRVKDFLVEPYRDMCIERLTDQRELVLHFGIPPLEDIDTTKPLHNHAVPGEGTYIRVRMQAYWLALHVWLLHTKQHLVQADEGLFGSAFCAQLTRNLFEWQWNQLRGWLTDADVPAMSITAELQDLQEFIFGFCAALDAAFSAEAPNGTAQALALQESDLPEGRYGIATQVKHVLWANVYSGVEDVDSQRLYDLTVYVLRQRVALERQSRAAFFSADFAWAPCELASSSRVE